MLKTEREQRRGQSQPGKANELQSKWRDQGRTKERELEREKKRGQRLSVSQKSVISMPFRGSI